ncbi:hypothetical protein L1987_75789 [Smallanthus sonchifolius]|uniref:Uncharacterized protein n=1 Tax=Smallanthus sonchifolius TaxID=185202 RepID=A0ACB9AAV2_9ASTR|nr:hypothetical protein L1987_75789 [Smallanthus sonchifolius]
MFQLLTGSSSYESIWCVSKHFRSIISDAHFIKSHLKKAKSLSTHHRILVPTYPLLSLNYNLPPTDINASVELNCQFLNPRNVIKILGSCNGLVCIIDGSRDLTIYNPSTRRYFKPFQSPPQVLSCSNESNQTEYVYGFGYGSNPNDLKVVRFPRFARDSGYIYDFIDTADTFLNGSIHWPLISVSDDEIVVEIDLQSYVIYNGRKKTFRRVKGVGNLKWFGDATVYVESLLSPQVSCVLY